MVAAPSARRAPHPHAGGRPDGQRAASARACPLRFGRREAPARLRAARVRGAARAMAMRAARSPVGHRGCPQGAGRAGLPARAAYHARPTALQRPSLAHSHRVARRTRRNDGGEMRAPERAAGIGRGSASPAPGPRAAPGQRPRRARWASSSGGIAGGASWISARRRSRTPASAATYPARPTARTPAPRQSLVRGRRVARRDGRRCIVGGARPPVRAAYRARRGCTPPARITAWAEVRDGHQLLADVDAQGELIFAPAQSEMAARSAAPQKLTASARL
jgi:hypothetical protein